MRKILGALVLAISLLAGTVGPVLGHNMALTLSNGTCVLVPHNAGNTSPAPVPSGLSVANPLTDAIVSVSHGGSCP